MGREWPTRSFKSGNSVAVRIPAGVGLEPNKEWVLIEREGELAIRAADQPKRKFNIDKVRGCAIGSGLRFIEPEERVFEERPLLWDDPEWRAKYMPGE
jgi:antitoxin VapB